MATYNKTLKVLESTGDKDLYNVFTNVASDVMENTYVMENILAILEDNSVYKLEDDYRIKLVKALRTHFELVWTVASIDKTNIDRLLNFLKEDVYFIEAYNGYRMATKKEVENGATGLIAEERWLFGEQGPQIYKQLNILQWAITGRLKYYTQAGLGYTWGENGLEETFTQLFGKSTEVTMELYDLLRDKNKYNNVVSTINKAIRRGRNKYPDFAPDEVEVEISKKQLIYKVQSTIWNYEGFNETKRILTRIKRDKRFRPTPLDISTIRKDYEEITSVSFQGKKVVKKNTLTDEQQAIKDKCDAIEKFISEGLLNKNEFSLKIIQTIKKYNYRFCSEKQMSILDESIGKAIKAREERGTTPVMTDEDIPDMVDDIFGVMDALGRGELHVEYGDEQNE